ncbi:MAG TPA: peptidoglycan editing factor PgeF [Syntrophales bacterium]|nr:peptidoglycan editing factor PgeF [Syntrophales bacterium]
MFELVQRGSVSFLQCVPLRELGFVTHAFCTRREGASSGPFESLNFSSSEGDPEECVRANWDRAAEAFGLTRRQFFNVHQVHGNDVLVIDDPAFMTFTCQPLRCDAIVTTRPGLALCIRTADCVPILMADPRKGVVAAVHAGWRGTSLGVAGRVADCFRDRFSSDPRDLLAAVGPAIGPCCYEVDAPVQQAMENLGPGQTSFLTPAGPGKWRLDLAAANRSQLLERGFSPENVHLSGTCTSCGKERWFSHRRDAGRSGRHLNFILMDQKPDIL